jgi:hypothetical protein
MLLLGSVTFKSDIETFRKADGDAIQVGPLEMADIAT